VVADEDRPHFALSAVTELPALLDGDALRFALSR
jgi:hypothetical protein